MTLSLFPFQEEDAALMSTRPRNFLSYWMGLGKSVTAARAVQLAGLGEQYAVFCPAIARMVWREEPTKIGLAPPRVLLSYDKAIRIPDLRAYLRKEGVRALILDEAHYLKSPSAKRTKAVLGKEGPARAMEVVHALTASPMPNHPAEMYALLASLWPGPMATWGTTTYWKWVERTCHVMRSPFGVKVVGAKNPTALREFLRGPIGMIRRTLDDEAVRGQLPPITYDTHRVSATLTSSYLAELEHLMSPALLDALVEGELPKEDSSVSRLRRLLGQYKGPIAGAEIAELLADETYDKVAVFATHHTTLDALQAALTRFGLVRVDGSTSDAKREQAVSAFQHRADCRVFLGQTQACAGAITLTATPNVEIVEPPWGPEDVKQLGQRAHRWGQERPVRVRLWALRGTVDEAVLAVVRRKAGWINEAIDGLVSAR